MRVLQSDPELSERAERILRDLATQLGTTTEKLWDVMVAGQYAMGYKAIVFAVLCAVLLIIGVRILRKVNMDNWEDKEILRSFIGGVIALVGFIGGAINLDSALERLLSPEYSALHKIAEWWR